MATRLSVLPEDVARIVWKGVFSECLKVIENEGKKDEQIVNNRYYRAWNKHYDLQKRKALMKRQGDMNIIKKGDIMVVEYANNDVYYAYVEKVNKKSYTLSYRPICYSVSVFKDFFINDGVHRKTFLMSKDRVLKDGDFINQKFAIKFNPFSRKYGIRFERFF